MTMKPPRPRAARACRAVAVRPAWRFMLASLSLRFALCGSVAADLVPEQAGGRYGYSSLSHDERFTQTEAFARWPLRWQWNAATAWRLRTQLAVTAGQLSGRSENGFIATAGPAVRLEQGRLPISFVGGVSPTVLERQSFPHKDFGMALQFTSWAGFEVNLGDRLVASVHYQHMSNAHLSDHNPGLNLLVFSVGYHFREATPPAAAPRGETR